jgi:hypothetical protein
VCVVDVYLGDSRLFIAMGAWSASGVAEWSGGAGTMTTWRKRLAMRSLRAAVHSDGTIHPWQRAG